MSKTEKDIREDLAFVAPEFQVEYLMLKHIGPLLGMQKLMEAHIDKLEAALHTLGRGVREDGTSFSQSEMRSIARRALEKA